jgi:predicted MFS family arabinose efflux permease
VVRILVAAACALALADASIVTLALPAVFAEFDATVEGVAAVIGVYTLALAAAALPAEHLRRRLGAPRLAAGGMALFAAASLACGLADSLSALIAFRVVQAAGGAALLVGGFTLLGGARLWTVAAIFGTAAGPALGGLLTELLDWRAIFLAQVPVAAAAAVLALRASEPAESPDAAGARASGLAAPAIALALLSAALTAVLFLLVLLLVSGWSVSPLAAAAAVTVLPLAAVAGARVRWADRERAAAGSALVGAGVLALAFVPTASVAWVIVPQLLAGAGMGMALPALAGGLLPERTPRDAARLLAFRHAGITIALAVLAPITAAQLDGAIADSREKGAAVVLDARLPPLDKLGLAGALVAELDPVDPREDLREKLTGEPGYAEVAERADETLVAGVNSAFEPALLLAGLLGLAAALVLRPPRRALAIGAAALLLPLAAAVARPALAPDPVEIRNPCEPRDLPSTGGIAGFVQDAALVTLDRAACRFGSSREELAIAIADPVSAIAYAAKYGVDPRDIGGLLGFP